MTARPLRQRIIAIRILVMQCVAVVLVSSAALIVDRQLVFSVLLGAGISIIGNLYFVVRAFMGTNAGTPVSIVSAFYRAQAGKFVLILVMFGCVFRFIDLARTPHGALALLVSFAIVQVIPYFLVHYTSGNRVNKL